MVSMTCAFCGKTFQDDGEVVPLGWEPYFYIADHCIDQSVCPDCSYHIRLNPKYGECEIVHDYNGPIHRYDFVTVAKVDSFYFLRTPTQEHIDYLAQCRPGCNVLYSLQVGNHHANVGS